MKNILLIMPYGSVGGMERLAFTFYNYYTNQGYTVKALKIIKLDSDIINFGEDELFLSQKDFGSIPFLNRFFFYLTAPFQIRKIILKNKITHSISFGDMANIFSSLTFSKEFKVSSIHALKSVEFSNSSFLNTVFKFGFRSSYYFFDKVVCISEAIKKDLIENCNFKFKKKLQVIYNPHDINEINLKAKVLLDSNEENIFGGNVIVFLGRLSIQKAPWHLIKAFSLLLQEKPTTKLVLIGDGDGNVKKYLKELIFDLKISDNVIFLGRTNNPYKYLKRASVLALSSFYEGTPNVIVEAIALGIPIVSSNCTDGIIELMSLEKKNIVDNVIFTESGLITPSFFKGNLRIPHENAITDEEIIFFKALNLILEDNSYKESIESLKDDLLVKFDVKKVANKYLQGTNN